VCVRRCIAGISLKTLYIQLGIGVPAIENFEKPLLSNLIKANFRLFEVPFRAVYNVKFLNVLEVLYMI